MPSNEDLKRAQSRREQRKKQREAAVEASHQQDTELFGNVRERQEAYREEHGAATVADGPQNGSGNDFNRTDRSRGYSKEKERARAKAEKEAEEQDRKLKKAEVDTKAVFKEHRAPTLHELNAIALQQNKPMRLDAKRIADAAGKAAFGAATGRRNVGDKSHSRAVKMRNAQAARAKADARQKAHAEKQAEQNGS